MTDTISNGRSLTRALITALGYSEALQKEVENTNSEIDLLKAQNRTLSEQLLNLKSQQPIPAVTCDEHAIRIDELIKANTALHQQYELSTQREAEQASIIDQLKAENQMLVQQSQSQKPSEHKLLDGNLYTTDVSQSCLNSEFGPQVDNNPERPADQSTQVDNTVQLVHELRDENNLLKSKLEKGGGAADVSTRVDFLFKQNMEKQAENDRLKEKVRLLQKKERQWRLKHPEISSPLPSSDNSERASSPLMQPTQCGVDQVGSKVEVHVETSNDRKRLRTRSPPPRSPLREVSANIRPIHSSPSMVKSKRSDDRGSGAVHTIAEDGESLLESAGHGVGATPSSKVNESANKRLESLLFVPGPESPVLRSPKTADSIPATGRPLLLSKKAHALAGPEDSEPFRARPVSRLNLSHFKVNPRYNNGEAFAYAEVVRSKEARKCLDGCTKPDCCGENFRALATSVPQLLGGISDDQLLIDFLGPGQENMIKDLTSLARSNLISEARTKKLADAFGKLHRTAFDRAPSPPGYWSTEMQSSQEERDNIESAKVRERKEVERRFREAMKDDGRWLFADE